MRQYIIKLIARRAYIIVNCNHKIVGFPVGDKSFGPETSGLKTKVNANAFVRG